MRLIVASVLGVALALVAASVAIAPARADGPPPATTRTRTTKPTPSAKPAPKPAPKPEAAPGIANIAVLTSMEGVPTDSIAAPLFVRAFRGAFDADYYLTEPAGPGHPRVMAALTSQFRLLHVQGDGSGWDDQWRIHVTIMGWWGVPGVPPASDTTIVARPGAGCRVNIAVLSPQAAALGARPLPVRADLEFEADPSDRTPAGLFAVAGHAVGLLAVEELHRQSGDLDEQTRLRLPGTTRRDLIQRPGSTPRR